VQVADGGLKVRRELEGGWFQWIGLPLSAVLTIQSGINTLRYATLKGIMAAKKKEIRKAAAPMGVSAKQQILKLYVPQKQKRTEMLSGGPAEVAKQLVKKLREDARVI
jgi:electron transfer flavoprotein beta subunit